MKKIYFILPVTVICIVGIIISGTKLHQSASEEKSSNNCYSMMRSYLKPSPEARNLQEAEKTEPEATQSAYPEPQFPEISFQELSNINSDIVAWINIEGTKINYPVVQGEDNDYYLRHLFDKTTNRYGCLFVDSRNNPDFTDKNTVIFGHNMKNGTMLSDITKYKDPDFAETHPTFMLMTPENNYLVRVFAGYVANLDDPAWELCFASDKAFEKWTADAKKRSCFKNDTVVDCDSCLVTLSTCSYEFYSARFVLLGVIEKDIQD